MLIPLDPANRAAFFRQTLNRCLVSLESRASQAATLRNYYLFGTEDSSGASYNRIQPTVDLLQSFIFNRESAKFSVETGQTAPIADRAKIPAINSELNEEWRDAATGSECDQAVRWALVYGCGLIKSLRTANGFQSYYVPPYQFGVYREDLALLDRQEAVVHAYRITMSQLEAQLSAHPERERLLASLASNGTGENRAEPSGIQRILAASAISTQNATQASVTGSTAQEYDYAPQVDVPMVDMHELWVWDDLIADWRTVTLANKEIIVYDRPNIGGVPGALPFQAFVPFPLEDYFWGRSFVATLARLQDWITQRMGEIQDLLARQLDPPVVLPGWSGAVGEKLSSLYKPRGYIADPNPAVGKPEFLTPQIPQDALALIVAMERMFDEMAGLSHVLKGGGDPGVRSEGHADLLSRLSSSRPKQLSLAIEASLELVMHYLFRLMKVYSDTRYTDENGGEFVLGQFTTDFAVRVDAHSSSPIFIEDRKVDAMALFRVKAIDRASLIEFFDPPNKQMLLENLKKEEAKEKAAGQVQLALHEIDAVAKSKDPNIVIGLFQKLKAMLQPKQ